jgi:MFS transporter, DHA2 family, multidrug resistance protein
MPSQVQPRRRRGHRDQRPAPADRTKELGFAVASRVDGASGLAVVVIGLVIVFAGLMPVSALGVDVVLGATPTERAGAASAVSETTEELGLALGIALLGSIGVAVYRGQMLDAVAPGVTPEAAEAARDTLGGATGVAEQLPPGLLVTAGNAFTDGLQLAAAVSAVALAGVAVVAAIVLRRVGAGSDIAADSGPSTASELVGER